MVRRGDYPKIHTRASILAFIQAQLQPDGSLPDSECPLPDLDPTDPRESRSVIDVLDEITGQYLGTGGPDDDTVQTIIQLIIDAAAQPRPDNLRALYTALVDIDAFGLTEHLVETFAQYSPQTATNLMELATWLATDSPDRNPTKIGLVLLGIAGIADGSILHQLGAHEEFTLFASIAFLNGRNNPDPDLLALIQRVTGRGRIHCMKCLGTTTDPAVARWILVDGFRTTMLADYVAYTAATAGDLSGALDGPSPDTDVLNVAGEILQSLIWGEPTEDIDAYRDAPTALIRWLSHMTLRAESFDHLLAAYDIELFCDDANWEARFAAGRWTPSQRARVETLAREVLDHPRWTELVTAGLESDDLDTFYDAERAARAIGIDPFDHLLARIEADPIEGPWSQAWEQPNSEQAKILLDRTLHHLDLDAIATGPSPHLGIGPTFRPHMVLAWTLKGLRNFPDLDATPLITAALNSPSTENRRHALILLRKIHPAAWNEEHRNAVNTLAAADPDDLTRLQAIELLESAEDDRS